MVIDIRIMNVTMTSFIYYYGNNTYQRLED